MRALAFAVLLLAAGARAQDAAVPPELAGTWSGAAVSGPVPRLFTLELSVDDGGLQTVLTQPYRGFDRFGIAGRYEAPDSTGFGHLTYGLFGDAMRLVVDLGEMTLRGTVVEGDSVTATVFLQRVVPFPLPEIEARAFRIASGADTLAGSLLLPAGAASAGGPHPAVVMVTGRGYGTRAETAALGRLLARKGIAALVWDGRGTGGSTGDRATVTAAERVADVRAVLDWAAAQPDLDAAQIGVFGSSAGGWIAPMAADGRHDVAFLLTSVGPAEGLADQQGHTTTELMRRSDSTYTDAEYAAAFAYQRDLVPMAQTGAPWAAFEAANARARAARWAEHALIPDSLTSPDLDYYARMRGLDAGPALSRWARPLLAVYGADDWIVPPRENVPLFRRLTESNPDATAVVLQTGHASERPAADVGEGAWPYRYRRSWTRAPEWYTTLLGWLDEQTTTAAER